MVPTPRLRNALLVVACVWLLMWIWVATSKQEEPLSLPLDTPSPPAPLPPLHTSDEAPEVSSNETSGGYETFEISKKKIVTRTDLPNIFTSIKEFEPAQHEPSSSEQWLESLSFERVIGTVRGLPRIRASEQRPLSEETINHSSAAAINSFHNENWNSSWSSAFAWDGDMSFSSSAEAEESENDALSKRMKLPNSFEEVELLDEPLVGYYRRPNIEDRMRNQTVRIACLFAGFVRDFFQMFQSCTDVPRPRKYCLRYAKFYGNMRDNILHSTGCDIYISTWDIKGAGRYDTTKYTNATFSIKGLHALYKDQLAAYHVQRYAPYSRLWNYMNKFSRPFPQSRPQVLYIDPIHRSSYFAASPEMNFFLRPNDYSQSYKQWCVLHLARLSGVNYDLYYRLRFDLRVTSRIHNFQFAKHKLSGKRAITFELTKPGDAVNATTEGKVHYVTAQRLHVQNFDIGDFGFLGTLSQIEMLSRLWYYCTSRPGTMLTKGKWVPFVYQKTMFSEYNYMIWRIIFDQKWSIDNGGRYLWVSRNDKRKPKKEKR